MSYYPARFHFADLVLAALIGFMLGALIFKAPSIKADYETPYRVVAEVRE